jgi:hypothetical protein
MPVATVPAYDEMWVNPQVVAALSSGVFTYTEVAEWAADQAYNQNDSVLHGEDAPYGGYVWTATAAIPAGAAPPCDNPAWLLDQQATADRLRLFTATTQATWLLDTLTGYTLHGVECWSEDYGVHTCTIRLRRTPVEAVHSVVDIHRCNQPGGDNGGWCHVSAQTVSLCCGGQGQPTPFGHLDVGGSSYGQSPQCGCGNAVRITYTIGANLPPGSEALAAWLATEYGKAVSGQPCALPERITSVSRQGVSWTVLDPQDFLDKGYTGMSRVDHWLAAVKPTIGGQLIDPLTSHRLSSLRVDCPIEPAPVPV